MIWSKVCTYVHTIHTYLVYICKTRQNVQDVRLDIFYEDTEKKLIRLVYIFTNMSQLWTLSNKGYGLKY